MIDPRDFIEGAVFVGGWVGLIALLLLRQFLKWIKASARWHIVTWFLIVMPMFLPLMVLAHYLENPRFDEGLGYCLEAALFGFTAWFAFGGTENTHEPGVSREHFSHDRVKTVEGLSGRMKRQAAQQRKAVARERSHQEEQGAGVSRQPYRSEFFRQLFPDGS